VLAASGVWAGQQVSLFAPTLEWANFPRRADLHVSQAIGCRIRMRVEPGLRSSGSLDRRRGGAAAQFGIGANNPLNCPVG